MSSAVALPEVAWAYCRGTVASQCTSNLETIAYGWNTPEGLPNLTLSETLDKVPEISKIVKVGRTLEAVNTYDSKDLLHYAKWIASLDPNMPVILTHGTNIISEVAFFLDCVLDRPAPVIVTGAMRPISALSCDGQMNLVHACGLATHPSSRGRGVMIMFNDRITSGYYAVKSSANRMDTFKCFEAGHLGLMNNLTPHYFFQPARPTNKPYFDIGNIDVLPEVAIITCYIDMKTDILEQHIADTAIKGIVVAGFGAASVGFDIPDRLVEIGKQGYPVVRTSLHPDSHTTPSWYVRENIASGDLGPAKAALLLRLAIATHGQDVKKIRQVFGTDFERNAVPT